MIVFIKNFLKGIKCSLKCSPFRKRFGYVLKDKIDKISMGLMCLKCGHFERINGVDINNHSDIQPIKKLQKRFIKNHVLKKVS